MKNNGIYQVLSGVFTGDLDYVIAYIERGKTRYLEKYIFADYDEAVEYMETHKDELDTYVTELKEAERIEREKQIQEEKEKAEREKIERELADEKKKKRKSTAKKTIIGILIGALIGTPLGYLINKLTSDDKKDDKEQISTTQTIDESTNGNLYTKINNFLMKKGILKEGTEQEVIELSDEEILSLANEFFTELGISSEELKLNDEQVIYLTKLYLVELGVLEDKTAELDVSTDIDSIATKEEELSTENFEKLVAEFAKPYIENGINVTTEDITKFVSFVNIDKLAEENPELASELFGTQTREEYLNDAAKIIGMTYMYNHNIYEKEQSTENFIRISDAVYGPQKEKLQLVEEYVTKVAASQGNSEEVNKIVSDFLLNLSDPTRELSYLDDGVGFGMQVDIALILNSIGGNDLNQENRDWLQELTSSEKYVSNIFTVYERCTTDANTRTRG